jgi:hypothetical protein
VVDLEPRRIDSIVQRSQYPMILLNVSDRAVGLYMAGPAADRARGAAINGWRFVVTLELINLDAAIELEAQKLGALCA